ncbi:MAG: hypothetical protein WB497_17090, partial [Pseudolabrys sp.]
MPASPTSTKSGASPLTVVVGSIVAYDLILMVRVRKRPIVRVPNRPATFTSSIPAVQLWRKLNRSGLL